MAVKTFSVGETLTASDTNTYLANSGLVVVTPSSVSGATLSGAKTTIGTGVSTVTLNGIFSATYENYRVVISGGYGSGTNNIQLQFNNVSGTNYFTAGNYINWAVATNNAYAPAASTFSVIGFSAANYYGVSFDVLSPYLSTRTGILAQGTSHYGFTSFSGYDNYAASQTGFNLTCSGGGTFTGGTIMVYGYRVG